MNHWKRLTPAQINERVFEALNQNVDFRDPKVLGVPASHLDDKVFYADAPFLKDAPYLATLVQNPNHIGLHTTGVSEHYFAGTQALEREVIRVLAEDLLFAEAEGIDGYIASGGTEANTQAIWLYRNEFMQKHQARLDEIALLYSADSHYSMPKAANLLQLATYPVAVQEDNRALDPAALADVLGRIQADGRKYVIVVANLMTTMFGSVDDTSMYVEALQAAGLTFRLHLDGAYGGFFYPVSNPQPTHDFRNEHVSSITLDAHKMLQAPYGTGVFLARKGLMHYVHTGEAQYVEGQDTTMVGSRSGANAVAVWMILMTYGPHGWFEKVDILRRRTEWLARQLDELGVRYYKAEASNILTMRAEDVPEAIAKDFGLVPDQHDNPRWYKVVVMDHVTIDALEPFVAALKGKE
ncbi:MAG: pyridoxal-dependent decarboxylase [Bacteroidota bacterium]